MHLSPASVSGDARGRAPMVVQDGVMTKTSSEPRPSGPLGTVEALEAGQLRWTCGQECFPFETTHEVQPIEDVVGQDPAVESLRFGLETDAPGQNIFVRGITGSGRLSTVQRLLASIQPACSPAPDFCFVHRFHQPDRPRLITLPRRDGVAFEAAISDLVSFIRDELAPALSSEILRARQSEFELEAAQGMEALTRPFDEELRKEGLALVALPVGDVIRPAITLLVEGEPISPQELVDRHADGRLDDEAFGAVRERVRVHDEPLRGIAAATAGIRARAQAAMRELHRQEARSLLDERVSSLRERFPDESVSTFLDELIHDVVSRRLDQLADRPDFLALYSVNPLLAHGAEDPCPAVVENVPTLERLLGTVDPVPTQDGGPTAEHSWIRAGALLRASGGYLILDAREVASRPESWAALIRTLRGGRLDILPSDLTRNAQAPSLKPDCIPIDVKVILIGDGRVHQALAEMDPDFVHLFKVLADFDSTMPRDEQGLRFHSGVLARIVREEGLPALHRGAVAALCEHSVRIAARLGQLTARIGRVADLAREAAFLARRDGRELVTADDVRQAVRRTKSRADLPSRKFRPVTAPIERVSTRLGKRG